MTPRKYKDHKEKNKDLASKIRKIVWVNNSTEDFAADFKAKITRNEYSSILNAYKDAQKLYSEHCPEYQSGKAVVSSINGVKQVKRKAIEPVPTQEPEPLVTSTPNDPVPTIIRHELFQTLREMLIPFREMQQLKNDQLRHRLSENNDSNNFITSINDYTPPTTFQQRMADYMLTQLYVKFQDLQNN